MRKKALLIIIVSVFIISSFQLSAQSSHVRYGSNGAMLSSAISFNRDGILDLSAMLGSSIGGFLDFGVLYSVVFPKGHRINLREEIFSINYGTMVMKQDNLAPISIAVTGTYGFTNVIDYRLENDRLNKEGTGFSFSARLIRDFILNSIFTIRVAAILDYRSYKYTTSLNYVPLPDAEPDVYPLVERDASLLFGANTSLNFTITDGLVISVGTDVLFDTDLKYRFRPRLALVNFVP